MRILHTADWHLGHSFHDQPRDDEHRAFLDWLLATLIEHGVDALIVAGDVFDHANPSAQAEALFYGFLARLARQLPQLGVVIVAGNHDSAARLAAPHPLLAGLGIHVVGAVGNPLAEADIERLLVPLCGRDGEIGAWCAAVPFLRPMDLPRIEADDAIDPLIEGVRRVYAQVLDAARARCQPGQALVATGHCYMVGGALSELSERRVLGGNQHALPADLFPTDLTYVALGHLHRAQRVGGREQVRYSGSPIPLAFSEVDYPHQVVLVELPGEPGAQAKIEALRVPRHVELLRVGHDGRLALAEVGAALDALALDDTLPESRWPYLEITVRLDAPEPSLHRLLGERLAGRPVRLLSIRTRYPGKGEALADDTALPELGELQPETVFARRYRSQFDAEPPEPLHAAFDELLASLAEGER
ncbi:exonuclease SbcCD subunit D C-terminal domain-containing protein [Chitinivorax sp. PXF-14]|uniref:exonuclease SbcCD subunit D C-terminal domain-containing protein n=1 Tax=Chitinivorax sp. PXF-14 TaxID=3230488 RepID=UPI003466302A